MTDSPRQSSMYRFEIIRHMLHEPHQKASTPQNVCEHFAFMEQYDREHIIRVDLNNANEITGYETVSIGTDNMASVGPKEVFRGALLSGASCIILVHNHPSGQIEPSHEDHDIAVRLKRLGDELGLQLLDFVIIGRCGRYYSFAENQWSERAFKARTEARAARRRPRQSTQPRSRRCPLSSGYSAGGG